MDQLLRLQFCGYFFAPVSTIIWFWHWTLPHCFPHGWEALYRVVPYHNCCCSSPCPLRFWNKSLVCSQAEIIIPNKHDFHTYSMNWFGNRFKTETSWNHFLSYLQFSAWLISQWMVLANPAMRQELQGLWLNRSPVRKRIPTLCRGSGWIATTQKYE